jgi:acetyl coenzyme A synthetase (ADP forming)-like protein
MKKLNRFFCPRSIAIVGATTKKEKLGFVIAKNILDGGWKGKIFYVNPKHKKIGDEKCFANLAEIRKQVDLVLIAVPAPLVNQVIQESAAANPKIKNFIIISAGFKESGKKGKQLEENLKYIAETLNINVLGPNCLGFINPSQNLNATFTSGKFKVGKIAIISQSGALAVALLDWTENMSIGFSKVISIGNKALLGENEILEFLAGDKDTRSVALYIEDIKNGQKFAEMAKIFTNQKPIVALKAGKNRAGQKAISSHTGSLAQDEAVLEAIFEKLNIIEAKTEEEFQNLILFLSFGKIPRKQDVIILTNAGGPGALASDFIGNSKTLKLLEIPPKLKAILKKFLPESASAENPIDIIGDAAPERYMNALDTISKKFPENPLLVILTPQSQTDPENVAQILVRYKKKFSCLAAVFMGGVKIEKAAQYLRQNGIAIFENPEEALLAIEKIARYGFRQKKGMSAHPPKKIHLKLKINSIVQSAVQEKRRVLYWKETENIFNNYGVALAKSICFKDLSEIRGMKIDYPCVLKTDDPKIIHRWDKKAVILGINNIKELNKAYRKISKSTGAKNFLIQPMVKSGLEMIFGLRRDKAFGPVIVAGWGGTFTEVFKDRIIFLPLLTAREIKNKLDDLKISPMLKGYRGEKGYDSDEIVKIVLSLQEIASENPDISEIDINPAMLYNKGGKMQILDAKIYINN